LQTNTLPIRFCLATTPNCVATFLFKSTLNCHENGESAHEKSTTYEQFAIFVLRRVLVAHDACRKIASLTIWPELRGYSEE
jgi:hypothetical protein